MKDARLTDECFKGTNAADFTSHIISGRSDPSMHRATVHGVGPPPNPPVPPSVPSAPSCHKVSFTDDSSVDVGRVTINRAGLTFETSTRRKSQMVEQGEPVRQKGLEG